MLQERGTTITNVSNNKDPFAAGYRFAVTTYVKKRYLLMKEARDNGVDIKPFDKAVQERTSKESAQAMNAYLTDEEKGDVGKYFDKTFATPIGLSCSDSVIVEKTKERGVVEFHYCPLVAAWQSLGLSVQEIGDLCLDAMHGDEIQAEEMGFHLEIEKTIGCGHDCCRMVYTLKNPT